MEVLVRKQPRVDTRSYVQGQASVCRRKQSKRVRGNLRALYVNVPSGWPFWLDGRNKSVRFVDR